MKKSNSIESRVARLVLCTRIAGIFALVLAALWLLAFIKSAPVSEQVALIVTADVVLSVGVLLGVKAWRLDVRNNEDDHPGADSETPEQS